MNLQEKLYHYIIQGEFYKTVVEDGSDIIFIVDYEGNIYYHNASVEDTLGHKPNTLTGKNFFDFLPSSTLETFKKKFKECAQTPYIDKVEFQFLCYDTTYRYLEFNSVNIFHKSGIEGLLLDCRDITERKRNAEELLRARKSKEQFLANMSHEIRTPINGIAGMITLLEETNVTPEQKKYLDAIKNSTDNLKVIINDILDFSVIESGKLKFERIGFNIASHLPSVIETFLYQAKEKGIKLYYTIDPLLNSVILGDPVRYSQIVINLVSNAVKFTPSGEIKITARAKSVLPDKITIETEVSDTGIGITSEKLESIFESFNQGDISVTRRFGGTGLGLAISKQLVEHQNGKIKVNSQENVGTTFTFEIPYTKGSEKDLKDNHLREKPSTITNQFSFPGMKILLVEDNDINRMYAATILKRWDCDVDTAENGLIAVEKVKKTLYDIILMDIQMPVMDGYEASKAIKKSGLKNTEHIPIIALTANALKGSDIKSEEAGMEGYITKPFVPTDLHKILDQYYLKTPPVKSPIQKVVSDKEEKDLDTKLQYIDLSYLRSVCSNDKSFIQEMIRTFLDATPGSIQIIKEACAKQEWKKLGNEAHKIKPSITFMGIEALKPLVKTLEKNGKEGINLEEIPSQIEEFEQYFHGAKAELEKILKEKLY